MSRDLRYGSVLVSVELVRGPDGGLALSLDCPDCGGWGLVLAERHGEIVVDGDLSVERPVACRKPRCEFVGRIEGGRIEPLRAA